MIHVDSCREAIHNCSSYRLGKRQRLVVYNLRGVSVWQRQAEVKTVNALRQHLSDCCRISSSGEHQAICYLISMPKPHESCNCSGNGAAVGTTGSHVSDLLRANHYCKFPFGELCSIGRRRSVQIAFSYALNVRPNTLLRAGNMQ